MHMHKIETTIDQTCDLLSFEYLFFNNSSEICFYYHFYIVFSHMKPAYHNLQ